MKGRFLSRELTVWGVCKGLLVTGACFTGLLVVGITGRYIDRTWYGPWRSAQILEGVNAQTQTLDEQLQIIHQALARDHDNLDARFWLAWKLTAMKKYNEAAAAWV